jgi:Amidohydrolase family
VPRKSVLFLSSLLMTLAGAVVFVVWLRRPILSIPVAITNVTVIDGTGKQPLSGATVLIDKGRLAAISTDKVDLPEKAVIIDGSGKFLIPGMWDMHVHVQHDPDIFYPLFIANGVTGVRDMGGPLDKLKKWRSQIQEGKRIGPRIVFAGPHLDGPNSPWPYAVTVRTSDEAKNAVKRLTASGVDFIKVQSWLPREAYFAIARESAMDGIPFVGHVPDSVSVTEAAEAGQKSIEHMTGILVACSSEEAKLREMAVNHEKGVAAQVDKQAIESYDRKKAALLFQILAQRKVWQAPTLVIWKARASAEDVRLLEDNRLRYVPKSMLKTWEDTESGQVRGLSHEHVTIAGQLFRKLAELIPQMQVADVKFLAGTDAPFPFCIPGFSLHEELAILVHSGLTPMQAIQTATSNPAKFLGVESYLGTIEKGKLADLVLLRANPLANIENISEVEAVVANGHYYPKHELDRMLHQAQALAEGR